VLAESAVAGVAQWQCRVGHRYSTDSLLDAQALGIEAGLWAAVRALEDRRRVLTRLAERFEVQGQTRSAESFRKRAEDAAEQAALVRQTLEKAARTSVRPLDPDERAA
jgi:two-component system chemotaxis response regulator CheB